MSEGWDSEFSPKAWLSDTFGGISLAFKGAFSQIDVEHI